MSDTVRVTNSTDITTATGVWKTLTNKTSDFSRKGNVAI